eukprot:XP_015572743.1 uncharacterized protein LOC107260985 [Ricinus communis]
MSFVVDRTTVQTIMREVDSSRKVEASKAKELEKEEAKEVPLREYQPKIMYPARLKQFLKEILGNKRKFEDSTCVTLNKEYSAIFHNKLPEKRHDPKSFTIPCVKGNLSINDALADLGAGINVMSYSLFVKSRLGETKPTRMSVQLAYRSVSYPKGDETVTFDLHIPIRQSLDYNNVVYVVNVIDDDIETQLQEVLVEDPLHVTLLRGEKYELSNEEVLEQLEFMLANEPNGNTNEFTVIDKIGVQKLRPSLEGPLVLDWKELPQHLDYAYMDKDNGLHVIPAADLTTEVRERTLPTRRKYERATS